MIPKRNETYLVINRLLSLLKLLRENLFFSRSDFAAELGVNERTIQRDLRLLEELGAPLAFDRDRNGWYLVTSWWLDAPPE